MIDLAQLDADLLAAADRQDLDEVQEILNTREKAIAQMAASPGSGSRGAAALLQSGETVRRRLEALRLRLRREATQARRAAAFLDGLEQPRPHIDVRG